MDGYSNWHSRGMYERGAADERHQEYRQLIHDLSKKLSHENVQSISFLRRSSTNDCCSVAGHYPVAACTAHIAAQPPPPANYGLQLLEQLWHNGTFSETNLEPLVKLLRDIGRHDLADECLEKSTTFHRYRRYGRGEQLNRAVTQNLIIPPIPPTLLPSSPIAGLDMCRDSSDSNDRAQPSAGDLISAGESPAIERNGSFSSETETTKEQCRDISTTPQPKATTSAQCHATLPTGHGPGVDRLGMPRLNPQISQSIPTQSYLKLGGSVISSQLSTTAPDLCQLSTTAPSSRQLDLEASVSIHLRKDELKKLLQCNSDPELEEKLLTAYQRGDDRGSHKRGGGRAIMTGDSIPKVVMNSGRQMSNEASNFDSQLTSCCTDHHHMEKVLLRRQTSLLHVRNIETPIPAPLTPQPQKTHMKLEARSSNTSTASSDTDSGLSQCKSHRSSTVSNASSSDAFLSEEEDSEHNKEDDSHTYKSTQAALSGESAQRKDSGIGSAHSQQAVASGNANEHQSRNDVDRLQVRKVERNRSHSDHKMGGAGKLPEKNRQLDCGVSRRRQSDSTKDAMAAERRDKHDLRKGHHHISRKRYRAVSLPEFPPPNPLAKTGMTIDWRIPRDDFIDPIFHHKNKMFERKCRFSTGSGSSLLNVQLAIRLFPNGINWDQGSYSTLKVEITSTSRPPPRTAYIQFEITGYDCHAGHMIASRQVEYPLKHREFLIPEFLSHEVIKVSHAKNFEFRATIKIKYLVCSDWVVIPPDQVNV